MAEGIATTTAEKKLQVATKDWPPKSFFMYHREVGLQKHKFK